MQAPVAIPAPAPAKKLSLFAIAKDHSLSATTAVLFGLAFWRLGFNPELPAVLAFIFGGVLLAVIDWKVRRLPTRLVYQTLAGVAGGLAFASLVEWTWRPMATAAVGALLFASAFSLLWVFTKKQLGVSLIGFGDVRLAVVLGLLLGWNGLPCVLYGAIIGHLLALVIAIGTSIHRRKLVMQFAFGPPLIAGTLAVVLVHA
jgi:leader peptidase (prepilin peptidase)/N-methyltransferase